MQLCYSFPGYTRMEASRYGYYLRHSVEPGCWIFPVSGMVAAVIVENPVEQFNIARSVLPGWRQYDIGAEAPYLLYSCRGRVGVNYYVALVTQLFGGPGKARAGVTG